VSPYISVIRLHQLGQNSFNSCNPGTGRHYYLNQAKLKIHHTNFSDIHYERRRQSKSGPASNAHKTHQTPLVCNGAVPPMSRGHIVESSLPRITKTSNTTRHPARKTTPGLRHGTQTTSVTPAASSRVPSGRARRRSLSSHSGANSLRRGGRGSGGTGTEDNSRGRRGGGRGRDSRGRDRGRSTSVTGTEDNHRGRGDDGRGGDGRERGGGDGYLLDRHGGSRRGHEARLDTGWRTLRCLDRWHRGRREDGSGSRGGKESVVLLDLLTGVNDCGANNL
jgi:hypothetical protein